MRKIGIVLAGGGGKGAYQVGVWKALREFGVDQNIKAIAGTSVGALNSVLFLQRDYAMAENVWFNISPDKILSIDLETIAIQLVRVGIFSKIPTAILWLSNYGFFSRKGLLEIIRNEVDVSLVSNSDITCFA